MSPARRFVPRPGLARWLAAVGLLLAAPSVGAAQEADPRPMMQGTELFRAILRTANIQPLTSAAYTDRGPTDDTIVIVIGNPADIDPVFLVDGEAIAGQVLRAGGAVFYASDTDSQLGIGRALPGAHGFRVHGRRVWAMDRSGRADDSPNGTLVVPREPRLFVRGAEWEVFRGLQRVATEDPGCFVVGRYTGVVRHALAGFPPNSRFVIPPRRGLELPDREPDPNHTPDATENPFAVGGSGPDGVIAKPYRFLAVADQAVVMNRLIADSSTDNLELAKRIVRYLQDTDRQNRTHCLFVESGRVITEFDTAYRYAATAGAGGDMPLPSFEQVQKMIVDGGNRLIDRAQEEDTLNKVLLGPESQPARRQRNLIGLLQTLLMAGAVWAVWFVLRRVWRARQPTDQTRPPVVVPPKPGPPGIFTRREQELLRRNNLYEPIRDLLRSFFTAAGAPDAGRTPSRLAFGATGGKPARLQRAVEELWAVAFGKPRVLTVYQWQELEPKFEMVRRAFEDGAWRFEAAAAAARGGDG